MKTVIVPIDFSDTSLNAARFAGSMLGGKNDTRIVLYHMFENGHDAPNAESYLKSLAEELMQKGNHTIECIKEIGDDLMDCLERLAYQKAATLIVMGITGKSRLQQIFIGSNTLKMSEKNICPVMIIPPDAQYHDIKNIALTSDFQNVETSTPTNFIKSILEYFKSHLHIVHINNQVYISLTDEMRHEREKMAAMFKEYHPEFYFIGMNDYQDAIEQFVKDRNIDLIITIPRYHSGISSLFKSTSTKKLVFHSSIPVLAVHELM